jgi:hypothetical protein
MNLATRKYNLIQELASIDENLLYKLEKFIQSSKADWASKISAQEISEINLGIKQADENVLQASNLLDPIQKLHLQVESVNQQKRRKLKISSLKG